MKHDGEHFNLRDTGVAPFAAVQAPGVERVIEGAPAAGLELIARWAQAVAASRNLGDALDAVSSRPLPDDVARAVRALRGVSLDRVTKTEGAGAFGTAFERLVQACSEREMSILSRRLSLHPKTLEELAGIFGITRERVRQIQKRGEEKIAALAAETGCEEVFWRAWELHRRLGSAMPCASLYTQEILTDVVDGLPEDRLELGATILLWLAGPYRYHKTSNWIHAGAPSAAGPPASRAFLASLADDDGRIDTAKLNEKLADYGFVDAARAAWIADEPRTREVAGSLFLWHGTVADKAATVLLAIEEPATTDELNEMIGEGHSAKGLRGRLLDDERFIRTDRVRVGLRDWGLEEYTGIADEIEQAIDESGGEAALEEVISIVADRFGLRVASVESYACVPRFVIEGSRIRRRRPDEQFVPTRTIVDEPGCYVLDEDRCVLRLRVEKEMLRGSGRLLPQGLGSWLGVLPGAKRQFHVDDSTNVLVSWPDSALFGPSLGSIRRQVLGAGGVDGDQALLTFDRSSDTLDVAIVERRALETAPNWRRIQLLSGIEATDANELERLLAVAVGATQSVPLRARLRIRGERELSELLVPANDAALDDALSRLKSVL